MKQRIITAIVLMIIAIPCVVLGGYYFKALIGVVLALSVYEMLHICTRPRIKIYLYVIVLLFFLYGFIICLIQFFISLLYANIALYCCKQNKNKIVAIIMSFIIFIVIDIFVYIGIYIIFLNKFLGLKELSDYFNIAGYWFFDEGSNLIIPLAISFLLQLISFIFVINSFKSKEKVVLAYEKQIS